MRNTTGLIDADLSGADLGRANLGRADLSEANLTGANLRMADLSGANLTGADLREADLTGADLSWADLFGADLRGADLRDITVNWQSHDLITEMLRRAAGDDIQRRMLAGLVLISRELCWNEFLALEIDPALREWALVELRQWVKDGDGRPDIWSEWP